MHVYLQFKKETVHGYEGKVNSQKMSKFLPHLLDGYRPKILDLPYEKGHGSAGIRGRGGRQDRLNTPHISKELYDFISEFTVEPGESNKFITETREYNEYYYPKHKDKVEVQNMEDTMTFESLLRTQFMQVSGLSDKSEKKRIKKVG
jgi:hypothetical protein